MLSMSVGLGGTDDGLRPMLRHGAMSRVEVIAESDSCYRVIRVIARSFPLARL